MLTAAQCISIPGKVIELDLVWSNPFNALVTTFQSLDKILVKIAARTLRVE
ncbi:hypothetical protein SynPROS71_02191 [Synechococcus sp. PROS-7-1]|nr:hypothetical protein SynPROS71_02191 [Synechococcus sp. PROS-7-1]